MIESNEYNFLLKDTEEGREREIEWQTRYILHDLLKLEALNGSH